MTRRHMFFYSAKPFSHLAALVFLPLLIYPLWVLYFVFVDLFNPWQDAPGRRVWQTVPVDRRMAGQVRWLFGVVGGATLAIAYRTIILWFFVQESAHAITESIAYAGFYLLAASLAVATSSILHHLQDASTRPALMAWGWALGLILSLLAMEQLVRPTAVSMLFVWIGAIVAARGAYVLSADPRWFEWLGRQANQSVRRRTSEKTADPPAKPALDARVLGRLLDRKSVGTSDGSAMWWESLRPFQWHALLFLLFILSLPVLVVFELLTPGAALGWAFLAAYYTGELVGRTLFARIRCYSVLPIGQRNITAALVSVPVIVSTIGVIFVWLYSLLLLPESSNAISGFVFVWALAMAFTLLVAPLWLSNFIRLRGVDGDFFLPSLLMLLGCLFILVLCVDNTPRLSPLAGTFVILLCAFVCFALFFRQCGDDRRPRRMAIVPEED